jgi:large subunit ribosomal protein L22
MEAKAIARYIRMTPRKARRVLDLIRGKKAGEASVALKFMPYRAARAVEKVLKSAMANAIEKFPNLDVDSMRIVNAVADEGPMMKRIEPRAMGRANVIRKKTCHITIVLASGAEPKEQGSKEV